MDLITSTAAHWGILGVALLLIEVVSGTFIVVFFGLAALILAALKLTGLNHLGFELLIFALLGLVLTIAFRNKFLARMSSRATYTNDSNHVITLSSDIDAKSEATILYQGTQWTAVNPGDVPFKQGQKVTITKTEGIKLYLSK
jgi:membrane protein implicated in regulation of membrane protease activity